MSSSLSLRPESDPSIHGYRHFLKKVEKIMDEMTLSMLTSQRKYFKCFHLLFRLFGSYKYGSMPLSDV